MLMIILIVLFALISLGIFMAVPKLEDEFKLGAKITAGISLFVAVCLLGFSTIFIVPTREVGVLLTFSKPVGTVGNGLHVKAPWQSAEDMDAAIQTDNHVEKGGRTSDGQSELSCVTTRIAHQAVACVDVTIRWRIVEDQAANLFQDYREFGNVRDSLVTRDLNAAVNSVMESYDVLSVDDKGQSTAPELSEVASEVKTQLTGQIGDQIDVMSVIIPVVHFDASTQERVNALQSQIAQTRIAEQAEQTASAQARANRILAQSVSNDPNVLVSKCFDLLNESITKGYPLPAGFSCWGASSAVVVPAVK